VSPAAWERHLVRSGGHKQEMFTNSPRKRGDRALLAQLWSENSRKELPHAISNRLAVLIFAGPALGVRLDQR
jgi:hypothetical protein